MTDSYRTQEDLKEERQKEMKVAEATATVRQKPVTVNAFSSQKR